MVPLLCPGPTAPACCGPRARQGALIPFRKRAPRSSSPPPPRLAHPGRRGAQGGVCVPPPRCVSRVVPVVIVPPCRHVRAHTTPSPPPRVIPPRAPARSPGLSLGGARPCPPRGAHRRPSSRLSAPLLSLPCCATLRSPTRHPRGPALRWGGRRHPRALLSSFSLSHCCRRGSAPKPRDRGLPGRSRGRRSQPPAGRGAPWTAGLDGRRTEGTPAPAAPSPPPPVPLSCL